jgi:hydroxypyruvate isomerase
VFELSANVELLFTEAGADFGERIRAAADNGFKFVEMWSFSDKNLESVELALSDTGVRLWSMLIEPRAQLGDTSRHPEFLAGIRTTVPVANRLGCERIVTDSGVGSPSRKRVEQHATVVEALKPAAEIAVAGGVTVLLENVNTRVDHPGTLLDTAAECLEVIREVDSPGVRVLYDLYHSLVMQEDPAQVLRESAALVSHVQIADVPGRGEPGTGAVDWPSVLQTVRGVGYEGPLGLECFPRTLTVDAVKYIRDAASQV